MKPSWFNMFQDISPVQRLTEQSNSNYDSFWLSWLWGCQFKGGDLKMTSLPNLIEDGMQIIWAHDGLLHAFNPTSAPRFWQWNVSFNESPKRLCWKVRSSISFQRELRRVSRTRLHQLLLHRSRCSLNFNSPSNNSESRNRMESQRQSHCSVKIHDLTQQKMKIRLAKIADSISILCLLYWMQTLLFSAINHFAMFHGFFGVRKWKMSATSWLFGAIEMHII